MISLLLPITSQGVVRMNGRPSSNECLKSGTMCASNETFSFPMYPITLTLPSASVSFSEIPVMIVFVFSGSGISCDAWTKCELTILSVEPESTIALPEKCVVAKGTDMRVAILCDERQ